MKAYFSSYSGSLGKGTSIQCTVMIQRTDWDVF